MNMDMSILEQSFPKDQLNHLCFICLLPYFQLKFAILNQSANQCFYTHQLQFERFKSELGKHSLCAAVWQHPFTRTLSMQKPQ